MKIKRQLWYIKNVTMLIMLSACLKKRNGNTPWLFKASFHKIMHFFFGLSVLGFNSGRSDS